MQHTYKITKPCHKTWDELVPQQGGRYCGSCEKVVMDLDSPNAPKPGDANFTGCGKLTTHSTKFSIQKLNFFQSGLIKWLGVLGLFLIPSKKIKAQQNTVDNSPEVDTVNKRLYNVKRVVGQLREVDRSIHKGKIRMMDDTGIISEAHVLANGRFILPIDTSKIIGDSVLISSTDDSLKVKIDSTLIINYPKDSIFINLYPIQVMVTCGCTVLGPISGPTGWILEPTEIELPYKEKDQVKEREEKFKTENVDNISIPNTTLPATEIPKDEKNMQPKFLAVLNEEEKKKVKKGVR